MKIGIDISQIVYKGTGVARFTEGLVNYILDGDRKNKWLFFFSSFRQNLEPKIEKKITQKGHKLIKWKLPPTALSFLFNDLHSFSKLLTSGFYLPTSLDWLITSDWVEPPLNVKKATIVHDLVYLRHPETVDQKILETQKKRLAWVKRESKIIFADSYATKQDLINLLEVSPKKIYVNYPGVEVKKPTKEQINLTLKKYNLKRPFILTVGKIEPRKNLTRLFQAFKKIDDKTIDLAVVGPKGWGNENIKYQISNIKYLDSVTDLDLFSLYSACLFYIQPSLWEGFGYPIVEAMKLGVPVASSNTSSLKEIAKEVSLLFDPYNVDEMYHCIDTMIQDEKLRGELSSKGLERSKMFTWKKYFTTMIDTLTSY